MIRATSRQGATPPALVVRNAMVVCGDAADTRHARADIVIEEGRITAIGPDAGAALLANRPDTAQLDGSRRIALPGLVNAHVHSNEAFEQGAWDKLPLERWLLRAYPPLAQPPLLPLPARMHYLRTMLTAVQSLRAGVTSVQDDFLNPGCDPALFAQAMQAWADSGLRAQVAVTLTDRRYLDGMPFARELFPRELQQELDVAAPPSLAAQFGHLDAMRAQWHGAESGRLRVAIGPRGPQRCSRELLERVAQASLETSLAVHMHVLETRTQAVAGKLQTGGSFIDHLRACGLLNGRLTLNHAVWLTRRDIEQVGAAGCTTVHNALSNLKLGSGISPVRRLLAAGANVALGSDGASTSDTVDLFESVRMASLVHTPGEADPSRWIAADEAFAMATRGGAASMGLAGQVGELVPGANADLILLDRDDWALVPLNDPVRQLAYTATSSCVDTVVVAGRVLMQGRRLTLLDEAALRAEIGEAAERYRRDWLPEMARAAERFDPWVAQLIERARAEPLVPEPLAFGPDAKDTAAAGLRVA